MRIPLDLRECSLRELCSHESQNFKAKSCDSKQDLHLYICAASSWEQEEGAQVPAGGREGAQLHVGPCREVRGCSFSREQEEGAQVPAWEVSGCSFST